MPHQIPSARAKFLALISKLAMDSNNSSIFINLTFLADCSKKPKKCVLFNIWRAKEVAMEQSQKIWILIFLAAAVVLVTLGLLLVIGVYLYLTPAEAETSTPAYYAEYTGEAEPGPQAEEPKITSERVAAIAAKIEGIDEINPGATFGLYVEGAGNYTVGKTDEGIMVVEGGQEYTDIDLFLDSMATFEEVENAEDTCAAIRELRNAGNITYEYKISEMQMYFKGYLALEPCLK